jgi:hypothetical protein
MLFTPALISASVHASRLASRVHDEQSAVRLDGGLYPPLGLGAMFPVAWYRCAQMITTLYIVARPARHKAALGLVVQHRGG